MACSAATGQESQGHVTGQEGSQIDWLLEVRHLKSNNGMLNFTFSCVDFADGNLYKRGMCKVDTLHLISQVINFSRYPAPSGGLRVSPQQFSHLLGWFCTCGALLTCLMLSCCRPPLSALSFLSPLTRSVMSAAPTDGLCLHFSLHFFPFCNTERKYCPPWKYM